MNENPYALPNALDSLDRQDFKSDTAYYEAAADLELKRSSREFQDAYSRVVRVVATRKANELSRQTREMIQAEAAKVQLTAKEEGDIAQRIQGGVATDIQTGKLDASQMLGEIDRRTAEALKQAKHDKALRLAANKALQGGYGVTVQS